MSRKRQMVWRGVQHVHEDADEDTDDLWQESLGPVQGVLAEHGRVENAGRPQVEPA